jgi:hypothetical protein
MKQALLLTTALSFLAACRPDGDGTHTHAHAHAHDHAPGQPCSHSKHAERHDAHRHDATDTAGKAHAHHERPQTHNAHARTLSLAPDVQRAIALSTVKSERRRIQATRVFPGRYVLAPQARQTVGSPVGGRLTLLVSSLQHVVKGEALFTVASPDLIARAREIATLEKRLAVYRALGTPNAELENRLAVKRAERDALLAGAEDTDGVVTVRAPGDGLVETLAADNGAWLETGAAVLQLTDMTALRFTAFAAAADAQGLTNGMPVTVDGKAGSLRLGAGDDAGMIPLTVIFTGQTGALAGTRSHAVCQLTTAEKPQTAVPSDCLVSIGLQPTLFVRDAHDATRFIAVPVTPKESANGWTAVEGLPAENLEIVREGAYELKLALPGGETKAAGHFHADGTFHEGEH